MGQQHSLGGQLVAQELQELDAPQLGIDGGTETVEPDHVETAVATLQAMSCIPPFHRQRAPWAREGLSPRDAAQNLVPVRQGGRRRREAHCAILPCLEGRTSIMLDAENLHRTVAAGCGAPQQLQRIESQPEPDIEYSQRGVARQREGGGRISFPRRQGGTIGRVEVTPHVVDEGGGGPVGRGFQADAALTVRAGGGARGSGAAQIPLPNIPPLHQPLQIGDELSLCQTPVGGDESRFRGVSGEPMDDGRGGGQP